jgi:hypothetical protein
MRRFAALGGPRAFTLTEENCAERKKPRTEQRGLVARLPPCAAMRTFKGAATAEHMTA